MNSKSKSPCIPIEGSISWADWLKGRRARPAVHAHGKTLSGTHPVGDAKKFLAEKNIPVRL